MLLQLLLLVVSVANDTRVVGGWDLVHSSQHDVVTETLNALLCGHDGQCGEEEMSLLMNNNNNNNQPFTRTVLPGDGIVTFTLFESGDGARGVVPSHWAHGDTSRVFLV